MELLETPPDSLQIVARKVAKIFSNDIARGAETGMVGWPFWNYVKVLSGISNADVQENEGVNSLLKSICETSRNIKLPLLDARCRLKAALGGTSRCNTKSKWADRLEKAKEVMGICTEDAAALNEVLNDMNRWTAPKRTEGIPTDDEVKASLHRTHPALKRTPATTWAYKYQLLLGQEFKKPRLTYCITMGPLEGGSKCFLYVEKLFSNANLVVATVYTTVGVDDDHALSFLEIDLPLTFVNALQWVAAEYETVHRTEDPVRPHVLAHRLRWDRSSRREATIRSGKELFELKAKRQRKERADVGGGPARPAPVAGLGVDGGDDDDGHGDDDDDANFDLEAELEYYLEAEGGFVNEGPADIDAMEELLELFAEKRGRSAEEIEELLTDLHLAGSMNGDDSFEKEVCQDEHECGDAAAAAADVRLLKLAELHEEMPPPGVMAALHAEELEARGEGACGVTEAGLDREVLIGYLLTSELREQEKELSGGGPSPAAAPSPKGSHPLDNAETRQSLFAKWGSAFDRGMRALATHGPDPKKLGRNGELSLVRSTTESVDGSENHRVMFVHWTKGSKSRQGRQVRIDKQNLNIIFSVPRWNPTEDLADCQISVAACGVTMLKTTVARNVMSEDLAHLQEMWQTLVKSGDDACFDACIGCTMDDPFAIAPGVHIQRCALCSLAWHRFCGRKMREMSREKLPAAGDGVIASGTAVPEDFVAATTELCLMCRARLHGCAPEDDPEAAPAGGADLEPDSSKLEHWSSAVNYPPHPQHTP